MIQVTDWLYFIRLCENAKIRLKVLKVHREVYDDWYFEALKCGALNFGTGQLKFLGIPVKAQE